MSDSAGDVTRLLQQWTQGDTHAKEQLIERVYNELRQLARSQLARERSGHTLQPTALVHEAYLKLGNNQQMEWQNRIHFIAVAARVMRQILVDNGRRRQSLKRSAGQRVTLLTGMVKEPAASVDVLALDQAMQQLETMNAEQARIIELRYFGGLTIEETADVMQLSVASVNRGWRAARAWLYQQLETF